MALVKPIVLIVQADADSQEMYKEFLHHHGFQPIAVSAATEALAVAASADVVVTGIQLPGEMDGLELLSQLKRDERTRRTPVIILTAYANQRERAEQCLCDGFLAKPSLPEELLREIRRVLAASQLTDVRGEVIKADLRGDPSDRSVNGAPPPGNRQN